MNAARQATPLAPVARGVAAGLVGTACMTAWQEVAGWLKRRGQNGATSAAEPAADPWEKAPAPAQVAKRTIEALLPVEIGVERISLFTNAVHWGYGTALGAVYGLVQASFRPSPAFHGPAFGLGVWAQSYAMLVPMGLYKPPWRYPAKTIAKDLSYHLVYGAGVAAGYELVERRL